jgi:hypothetical protein
MLHRTLYCNVYVTVNFGASTDYALVRIMPRLDRSPAHRPRRPAARVSTSQALNLKYLGVGREAETVPVQALGHTFSQSDGHGDARLCW